MKKTKYEYLSVLQEYVEGCGWEDSVTYSHDDKDWKRELSEDIRCYRREDIQVRVVSRRELRVS